VELIICYLHAKGISLIQLYNTINDEASKKRLEELHTLCSSPTVTTWVKSGKIIWEGHAEHKGEMKNAHKIFVGKCERKRPLEKPRR
jgi:hypothetical protein